MKFTKTILIKVGGMMTAKGANLVGGMLAFGAMTLLMCTGIALVLSAI